MWGFSISLCTLSNIVSCVFMFILLAECAATCAGFVMAGCLISSFRNAIHCTLYVFLDRLLFLDVVFLVLNTCHCNNS